MVDTRTSEAILREGLERLRESIIERSIAAKQQASGRTYQALSVENVTLTSGELWGPTYIGVLEDGRKPGDGPEDFVDVIAEWMSYKGLTVYDPEENERIARSIAWSIIHHGTKQYRSGETLDIFETPIAEFEKYLLDAFAAFYATEITNTIRTAWENT